MLETGTSLLMAISGLHIALGGVAWLVAGSWNTVLSSVPLDGLADTATCRVRLRCLRLAYRHATPALRAYLCGLKRRMSVKATGQALVAVANLCCCIAAILLADPLAMISSLWLSVFTVAALIFWYQLAPLRRLLSFTVAATVGAGPPAMRPDVTAGAAADRGFSWG